MKEISLGRGFKALVDDEDYDYLNQWKWYSHNDYAFRVKWKHGKQKTIFMHRFILKVKKGQEVDHIDRNRSNNQKLNLRISSHSQNLMNQKLSAANTSGYKGVSFDKKRGKWFVSITKNRIQKNLGRFDTAIEGAKRYDAVAKKIFGRFANPNFK